MCHPISSDIHPHEFPKFQEQMSEFATLRDMVNWCIEKPNEGEVIDVSSEAMKALGSVHVLVQQGIGAGSGPSLSYGPQDSAMALV